MRSDSLAGERAAGKDAKAAASFNCLLLQRGTGTPQPHTATHLPKLGKKSKFGAVFSFLRLWIQSKCRYLVHPHIRKCSLPCPAGVYLGICGFTFLRGREKNGTVRCPLSSLFNSHCYNFVTLSWCRDRICAF